jgi:hypothetical protein
MARQTRTEKAVNVLGASSVAVGYALELPFVLYLALLFTVAGFSMLLMRT